MTFPRLQSLSAYWREQPSLRLQVAGIFQALLGVAPTTLKSTESQQSGSLDDLMADFQAMGGRIG